MSGERLDRLEERMAWLERHVVEQDKVMLSLTGELERLRAEVRMLRDRGDAGGASQGPASPADERPPHY